MTNLLRELTLCCWQKTGTFSLRACNNQPPLLPLRRVISFKETSSRGSLVDHESHKITTTLRLLCQTVAELLP